jgi:hypothetical protein
LSFYIIYILIIASLLLVDYFSNNKDIITVVVLYIVIIIAGIRENVGYDYANYVSYYILENATEVGFNLCIKALKLLGLNYNWMFIAFSFATIMLVYKGIKLYTKHTSLALFVFVLIPGLYLNSFSIVRQSIAIAILFYGYHFLIEKKYLRYCMMILLASSFHYTVLLTIPFFLISLKVASMKRWMYFVMIIGSIVLSQINISLFIFQKILGSTGYIAYATFNDGGASLLKIVILNIIAVFFLFFYDKMTDHEKTMCFFAILSITIVTTFGSIGAVTRFAYYFKIFEIILVSNIIFLLKSKINRSVLLIFIMGYYCAIFVNAISFDMSRDYSPKLTPYKTMFQK